MARSDEEWVEDIPGRRRHPCRHSRHGLGDVLREAGDREIGSLIHRRHRRSREERKPTFKAAHPDIPLRAIAGTRDRIVHEYFRTNTRRIWDVVVDDIDALEQALRKPMPPPPPVP